MDNDSTRNYRNKAYIAFDGDTDMQYYRLMEAWKENKHIDFSFYNAHDLNYARDSSKPESIKKQLCKRMYKSKIMVLLVGKKTKDNNEFLKWEIEHAKRMHLPIVVVNINGNKKHDPKWCPKTLDGYPCAHCAFDVDDLRRCMTEWPDDFKKIEEKRLGTERKLTLLQQIGEEPIVPLNEKHPNHVNRVRQYYYDKGDTIHFS